MLAINNTLVSEELIEKHFVCDLHACKGACCVKGDYGAPLEKEELAWIDANYEKVKPYFESMRYNVDKLEGIVDDATWPLPKYREMLYLR